MLALEHCACNNCPLQGRPHVPCHHPKGRAKLAVVGSGPGRNEEIEGEPFVGMFGRILNGALKRVGASREHNVFLTNALLCRSAPGRKLAPAEHRKAIACCKPRLEAELKLAKPKAIMSLGNTAFLSLTGKAKSLPWTGAVIETAYGPVLPNRLDILRKPSFIPVFKIWTARAWALANGALSLWEWPPIHTGHTTAVLETLRELLLCAKSVGVDVETAGVDPMTDDLLCIGISSTTHGVSVPWPAPPLIDKQIRALLADPDIKKTMHNGQHDLLSLEANNVEVKGYDFDTLLAHATVASQLPHDLGFVAATEFPTRWKTEFRVESDAKGAEVFTQRKIDDLLEYNGRDSCGTELLRDPLRERIERLHRGPDIFHDYMQLSDVALRMRRRGVLVDATCFAEHERALTGRLDETRAAFQAIVGDRADLGKNGQHSSLKQLFFDILGLKPIRYSEETGQPRLDALTLETYVTEPNRRVSELARHVLMYRKNAKLLSTYVYGLPLDKNNLVHCVWKVWGTITGRWASSSPNLQNQPKIMRNLYVPRPGNTWVKADYASLEIRIAALVYGATRIIEWLAQGIDVHSEHLRRLFPDYDRLPTDRYEEARDIIKRVTYCLIYGGDWETVWKAIVVKYPATRPQLIKNLTTGLKNLHPEIVTTQQAALRLAREQSYVEEPLSGRREYFHDGIIEPNKVLNFPIQGAAGKLMNDAILDLDKEIDWGPEGINMQVHDELDIEGPDKDRLCQLLKKHMEREVELNGKSVVFPIDIDVGPNWRDTKKVNKQ